MKLGQAFSFVPTVVNIAAPTRSATRSACGRVDRRDVADGGACARGGAGRAGPGSTRGRPALLERLVVVDLEVVGDVAPFDVALPMELLHRRAQLRRDRATQVRHRAHVGAVDEHHLHERVLEHPLRHRDRHRLAVDDLAHLTGAGLTAHRRGEVDTRTTVAVSGREPDPAVAPANATRASKASASDRSRRPSTRACSNSSRSYGANAFITRAVQSTGPRMSIRPAPSGSVQHRSDRDARTRSYSADSSTHAAAFTRAHASHSPRTPSCAARTNNSCSAPGSAAAASAMADTCALDSAPERHAASVVGSASTRSVVSTVARAEPSVEPVVADNHDASHAPSLAARASASRRARRSISSNTDQRPRRSGSRPASSLLSCFTAHRRSSNIALPGR